MKEDICNYQILLFYKYVYIDDPEAVRGWLNALCEKYSFKGRLIVATEGLNITLEGKSEDTESFIQALETDARFVKIHYKKSTGNGGAFPKLSVKVRSEIVTLGLGVCDIDPNTITGKRLVPETLHLWFTTHEKEFYIIDMRNVYEHNVGKFDGSLCPPMENFRDLPKLIKSIAHLKQKTVVTVCTGGVRCEKASGYLLSQGFSDVWQLDGGIVSYMEQYPNEHFKGKLYVFDSRVVMGFYTDDPAHEVIGVCANCTSKSENIVDCRSGVCNGQFILCKDCEQKQILKTGITHCPEGCKHSVRSPMNRLLGRMKSLIKYHVK